ncbi:MAG: hypothetical protein OEW09_04120 [Anaerolineae bacterium]|nr:hypothetical protein [Anaerolineae bacterium]
MIGSTGDLKEDLAAHLKIEPDSRVMSNLEWLGLLNDDPLPLQKGAPIDILMVPEIYEPVLEELQQLGIHFTEKWETLEE